MGAETERGTGGLLAAGFPVLQLPVALGSGKGNCCCRLGMGHFCFSVAVWEFGVLAGEGGMGVSYPNSLAKMPCLQLPPAGAGSMLENGLCASGLPAASPPLLLLTVFCQIEKTCKKISMGKARFLIISPHKTGSQRDRKREGDGFSSSFSLEWLLFHQHVFCAVLRGACTGPRVLFTAALMFSQSHKRVPTPRTRAARGKASLDGVQL